MTGWTMYLLLWLDLWYLFMGATFATGGWGTQVPEIWTKEMYPNPQVDVDRCGRQGKHSWVCDPNGILSGHEGDQLDNTINSFKLSTGPCICGNKCHMGYQGYQPAVALLNKLYFKERKPSLSQKKKAMDDFSDYLRDDSWEFGMCNDDFVIVVSKLDRQVYTAVGDNTRKILTDFCVDQVYRHIKPALSEGNYSKALQNMLEEYRLVLHGDHGCNKPVNSTSVIAAVLGVIGAIFLGCVGLCLCRRCKPEWFKGSGSSGGGGSPTHHKSYHSWDSRRRSSASSASSGGGGGGF